MGARCSLAVSGPNGAIPIRMKRVLSATILVGPANEWTEPLHDRMPVLLAPEQIDCGSSESAPEPYFAWRRPTPSSSESSPESPRSADIRRLCTRRAGRRRQTFRQGERRHPIRMAPKFEFMTRRAASSGSSPQMRVDTFSDGVDVGFNRDAVGDRDAGRNRVQFGIQCDANF
jgi:hypothetical protein